MTTWSYGITAVPSRYELLEQTVSSLSAGGFDEPILFIDGTHPQVPSTEEAPGTFSHLIKVYRERRLGPFSNFSLGLWELYIRSPDAHRFAMFQDDLICYRNLRQYLDSCEFPERGYWNLYTWPVNAKKNMPGWSLSDQWGRGAVALVFSNEGLRHLWKLDSFIDHKKDCHNGWKAIDKAVITAHRNSGWQEWIHNPSLVQHTGTYSSCRNSTHPESPVFMGENFDALDLKEESIK